MKKLDFGYNGDKKLSSQWSAIEPYNGEYLGMVRYENMDILITKIVDSFKGLNGGIDVREIAQDYYADGSYVTYANREKNSMCMRLEKLLNTETMRERLQKEDVYDILKRTGIPVGLSNLHEVISKSESVPGIVTTIDSEMFRDLKESKRYNVGKSIYYMAKEIQKLREELAEVKSGPKK